MPTSAPLSRKGEGSRFSTRNARPDAVVQTRARPAARTTRQVQAARMGQALSRRLAGRRVFLKEKSQNCKLQISKFKFAICNLQLSYFLIGSPIGLAIGLAIGSDPVSGLP